jgi:energy-coupling factor transporter transmembrane protein EcfT
MNIMDTLRKLDVFRSGSVSGTYKNAKERPTELMMDDVYNAKKDLVNATEDIPKNKAPIKSPKKKPKWPIWLLAVLGVFIMLVAINVGLVWFSIITLLWVLLIFGYLKFVPAKGAIFISFIIFSILFWFILILIIPTDTADTNKTSSGFKAMSASEMKNYDGKTFNITSNNSELNGKVSLSYTEGTKSPYLTAKYIIQINSDLPVNGTCGYATGGCNNVVAYEYANDLVMPNDIGDSEGSLSTAYCRFGEYPADFSDSKFYSREACGVPNSVNSLPTDKFVAVFSATSKNIDEIKSWTQFDLYDAANYWVQESADTSSIDTDAAVSGGTKVRSYTISYNE